MKPITLALVAIGLWCLPNVSLAQFEATDQSNITIIVTDGTVSGKDSPLNSNPTGSVGGPTQKFGDPIRALGMSAGIQAGAFLDRPRYGKAGFFLVFCVSDSIGGQQGTLLVNGRAVKGVYRLIRQKLRKDEPIPKGMTTYKLGGTVYFLGISQ
ncbi:MAG: hypothetical protein AAF242_13600 [Bacteroidota bacterium]